MEKKTIEVYVTEDIYETGECMEEDCDFFGKYGECTAESFQCPVAQELNVELVNDFLWEVNNGK